LGHVGHGAIVVCRRALCAGRFTMPAQRGDDHPNLIWRKDFDRKRRRPVRVFAEEAPAELGQPT
jgi:hypothetical protein